MVLTFSHPSWETFYNRELHNNASDRSDEGTIWFSESNAEDTVLRQLDKLASAGLIRRSGDGAARFLDLGTGNGHMLFQLREADDGDEGEDEGAWKGEMVGVDYSEASVDLARQIAEGKGSDAQGSGGLSFECWDLLLSPPGEWLGDGFDVVLDKGTFDAISLMEAGGEGAHPCDAYRKKVTPLVKPGCFLVVTSCNWTKDELRGWLSAPQDSGLESFDEARYPTFTFGGKTGQSIVTLVFRRNPE